MISLTASYILISFLHPINLKEEDNDKDDDKEEDNNNNNNK